MTMFLKAAWSLAQPNHHIFILLLRKVLLLTSSSVLQL